MDSTPDLADARDAARKVGDHPALELLARLGFAASGVLHILLGYTAGRVAFGGGGQADQSGALAMLASSPGGTLLMWLIVITLAGLVLWQLTLVVAPDGDGGLTDRAKALGKAAVYGALAFTAGQFAVGTGSSSSSEESSQGFTATLMAAPMGRLLVGVVGLVVIAVGGYHVYKGLSRRFLRDLEEHPGGVATVLGTIGYPAKGSVLALVGAFFVLAAVQDSSQTADGLDGALKSLRDEPFGPALLVVVAVGLVAFGLYCFARGRHQRI